MYKNRYLIKLGGHNPDSFLLSPESYIHMDIETKGAFLVLGPFVDIIIIDTKLNRTAGIVKYDFQPEVLFKDIEEAVEDYENELAAENVALSTIQDMEEVIRNSNLTTDEDVKEILRLFTRKVFSKLSSDFTFVRELEDEEDDLL